MVVGSSPTEPAMFLETWGQVKSKQKVMSKKYIGNNIAGTPNDCVYLHFSPQIQDLEGKMLTFIDASIQDPIQRKALKDLLRPAIWGWAIESNMANSYDISIKKDVASDIVKAL